MGHEVSILRNSSSFTFFPSLPLEESCMFHDKILRLLISGGQLHFHCVVHGGNETS